MIRPYRDHDLAPLMQLWLKSTTLAHPFIREGLFMKMTGEKVPARYMRSIFPSRKPGFMKSKEASSALSACWKNGSLARCLWRKPIMESRLVQR